MSTEAGTLLAAVPPELDPVLAFRQVASRFPTGVTVVGTTVGGEPYGTTANSFTTVSTDPLTVLVCLKRTGRMSEYLAASGAFSVSLLGEDQTAAARWFADSSRPVGAESFAAVEWRRTLVTGNPVLAGGVGYFDCTVEQTVEVGDHTIVVGSVVDFAALADGLPLLFWRSRLGAPEEVMSPVAV
ncbi:flavin reductase family protein [Kitasatospora sp. NPDC002227]|uniref:flavin reductase family protein n=1 Tax=Kitasatospora sp. NPDC002227 TaxID=3154773 RepID=UPI00331E36DB